MFVDIAVPLAVVPIVVNVGAAVLPAILGGVVSAASILFRPRELVRAVRRRPWMPVLIAAVAAGLWWLVGWIIAVWPAAPAPTRGAETIDWAQLATEAIHREQAASAPAHAAATQPTAGAVMLGRSAARRGYAGGPSPRRLLPLWRRKADDTMHLSSPAVVGNWVYGASCYLDPPSNYGEIFCLDAETGRKRWLKDVVADPKTGKEIELKGFFSSPAVTADGKYVVIGQGLHFDRNCSLLCFEAATGKLHWRVPTPLHIESSPAILGDLVVAGAGAVENEKMQPVGDPGFVLGVRISDGKVLWRQVVNDPESSPALSSDGICYIGSGFNGSELVALRTEGESELQAKKLDRVLWRAKTPYPATGAVTLWGEWVLIGCGNGNYVYADPNPAGAVLAFDRRTGRKAWEVKLPDAALGPIAAGARRAIVPVRNGEIVALNLAPATQGQGTDAILWRSLLGTKAVVLAGVAYTPTHVYAVSKDGYLSVLRASDGTIVERLYINDQKKPGEMGLCLSSPTVAGGRVYVGSETGGLMCLAGRDKP